MFCGPVDIVKAHNASAAGRCALWNVARLLFSSGFYTHDTRFLSRELEMYRFICLKFINIEKQFKTLSLDSPWAIHDEWKCTYAIIKLLLAIRASLNVSNLIFSVFYYHNVIEVKWFWGTFLISDYIITTKHAMLLLLINFNAF